MTKEEILNEIMLSIDKLEQLYGMISVNEPVRDVMEILISVRRRLNLEGITQ